MRLLSGDEGTFTPTISMYQLLRGAYGERIAYKAWNQRDRGRHALARIPLSLAELSASGAGICFFLVSHRGTFCPIVHTMPPWTAEAVVLNRCITLQYNYNCPSRLPTSVSSVKCQYALRDSVLERGWEKWMGDWARAGPRRTRLSLPHSPSVASKNQRRALRLCVSM